MSRFAELIGIDASGEYSAAGAEDSPMKLPKCRLYRELSNNCAGYVAGGLEPGDCVISAATRAAAAATTAIGMSSSRIELVSRADRGRTRSIRVRWCGVRRSSPACRGPFRTALVRG